MLAHHIVVAISNSRENTVGFIILTEDARFKINNQSQYLFFRILEFRRELNNGISISHKRSFAPPPRYHCATRAAEVRYILRGSVAQIP